MTEIQPQLSVDEIVNQSASIKKEAFKITIGVLFGVALVSVIARGVIRLKTQRHLSLDDYLLFIAAAFLTAATGLEYHLCDNFYIATAVESDVSLFFQLNAQQTEELLSNALLENIFLALAWSATFFVKFSFLAFFRQMIWRVDKIQYYYWTVVALTVLFYLFLVSEAFILCHDFGIDSFKCFDPSKNTLYISMTGLITGLDALSDIFIVSIPIIVLSRTKLQTVQKISLGLFLCLSLVMVCMAIIRVSKVHGATGVDIIWEFFWQDMESTVAVLMGALTVFRSLLIHRGKKSSGSPHDNKFAAAGPRSHRETSNRLRLWRERRDHVDLETQGGPLPKVPSATLTGLRTFIRRNHRKSGLHTQSTQTAVSQQYTIAQDEDQFELIDRKTPSQDDSQLNTYQYSGKRGTEQTVQHTFQCSPPANGQMRPGRNQPFPLSSVATSNTGTTLCD